MSCTLRVPSSSLALCHQEQGLHLGWSAACGWPAAVVPDLSLAETWPFLGQPGQESSLLCGPSVLDEAHGMGGRKLDISGCGQGREMPQSRQLACPWSALVFRGQEPGGQGCPWPTHVGRSAGATVCIAFPVPR